MSEEQREYWSKIASRYDRVVDQQIGPDIRSIVRDRLAKEASLGHLVEFGCGTGFYTQTLASKASDVVATDISSGMVALAKGRTAAANVTFRGEDCQETSFADASFDTAFMSLVLHFVDADRTLSEMRRILKPGGRLIIANLDVFALTGFDRVRCLVRIVYRGLTGYRIKPPARLGRNVLSCEQLCERLRSSGFDVLSAETIRDPARSSSIPVDFIVAVKT